MAEVASYDISLGLAYDNRLRTVEPLLQVVPGNTRAQRRFAKEESRASAAGDADCTRHLYEHHRADSRSTLSLGLPVRKETRRGTNSPDPPVLRPNALPPHHIIRSAQVMVRERPQALLARNYRLSYVRAGQLRAIHVHPAMPRLLIQSMEFAATYRWYVC